MEQTNDLPCAFVPGYHSPGSRKQVHLALVAREIGRRLIGQPDIVIRPVPMSNRAAPCS